MALIGKHYSGRHSIRKKTENLNQKRMTLIENRRKC